MLNLVFFVCFGVGVGFVVISFLIGEIGGESFSAGASFLTPSVIASFLMVFGGVGLIAQHRTVEVVAIGVSALAALAVSYLFFRFVIIPLRRAQNTSTVEKQSLIGRDATVVEFIPQGRFGKIALSVNGSKLSGPAKSEDGNEIARNQTVEIVYIDKNTYHVRRKGF
ncbi:MAG: NfeD family protein [Defluviitaleaceae bacterium]|nr:NfeD family protein [Defluviitaleaceae bacterium]